jgi:hypothetical protein
VGVNVQEFDTSAVQWKRGGTLTPEKYHLYYNLVLKYKKGNILPPKPEL